MQFLPLATWSINDTKSLARIIPQGKFLKFLPQIQQFNIE